MKYLPIILIFFTQYLYAQRFTLGMRSSYVIPTYSTSYGRFYLIDDKRFVFGLVSSQKLNNKIYLHEEVLYEKIEAIFGSRTSTPSLKNKVPMLTIPIFIEYRTNKRFGFEAGIEYNHFSQYNLNYNGSDNAYCFDALLGMRFTVNRFVAIDCRYLKQFYAQLWGKSHSLEVSLLAFLPLFF